MKSSSRFKLAIFFALLSAALSSCDPLAGSTEDPASYDTALILEKPPEGSILVNGEQVAYQWGVYELRKRFVTEMEFTFEYLPAADSDLRFSYFNFGIQANSDESWFYYSEIPANPVRLYISKCVATVSVILE